MKKLLLLIILLVPNVSLASGRFAEWGAGIMNDSQTEYSQVKFVELGKRTEYSIFDTQLDIGGWVDASHYRGAENSLYGEALFGLGPRYPTHKMVYYFGAALISHPDTVLATNFQFAHELVYTIQDDRKVSVFITFKHFSNAGIVQPNLGRNLIGLGLSF